MRIRKRQVPFPLSSLPTVPLSDPVVQLSFKQDPPLILSDDDDTAAYFNAPSSPLPIQLIPTHSNANLLQKDESSNDSRGAKIDTYTLANNEQSQQGKWHEGEKVIPLETKSNDERDNKKAKMNRKKKGKDRGGGLMEGSRCSRVNGRGWRCFQQTLVGYSLCEHHLGKGRLRSMASVRKRSKAASFGQQEKAQLCSSDDDDEEDNRKARSMSSLLGQHINN